MKTFCCFICKTSFTNRDECKKHMHSHKRIETHSKIQSDINNKKEKNITSIIDTKIEVKNEPLEHEEQEKLLDRQEWSQRGISFPDVDNVELHKETHSVVKSNKSSHSDKAYVHRSKLIKHLRTQLIKQHRTRTSEKPYHCNPYGKIFSKEAKLIRRKRIHTGVKPYQCSHCDKRFAHRGNLTVHQIRLTSEKLYYCIQCNERFALRSQIIKRQQAYIGGESFLCNHCDKSFICRNALKVHLRTHTGEKLFQCSNCDKVFLYRSKLKVHQRKHTGEEQ